MKEKLSSDLKVWETCQCSDQSLLDGFVSANEQKIEVVAQLLGLIPEASVQIGRLHEEQSELEDLIEDIGVLISAQARCLAIQRAMFSRQDSVFCHQVAFHGI